MRTRPREQTPRRHDATERRGSGGAGSGGAESLWSATRAMARRVTSVLRQVVGAPDYDRYLAHHASHHAGTTPLGPREFYAEFVSRRFGPGPTRCC